MDVLAVQGDRLAGKETLPILLGKKKSMRVVRLVLTATVVVVMGSFFLDSVGNGGFWLAIVPLFMLLLIKLYKEDSALSGSPYEFTFESLFLLAGVIAALL